jgi:hypothetical protein
VSDALARRQLAAHVLLDEVDERDDHLGPKHGDHQHRPQAAWREQAEDQEQRRIGEVARAMEPELAALLPSPGDPLGHLMMVDDVEQAERELD